MPVWVNRLCSCGSRLILCPGCGEHLCPTCDPAEPADCPGGVAAWRGCPPFQVHISHRVTRLTAGDRPRRRIHDKWTPTVPLVYGSGRKD